MPAMTEDEIVDLLWPSPVFRDFSAAKKMAHALHVIHSRWTAPAAQGEAGETLKPIPAPRNFQWRCQCGNINHNTSVICGSCDAAPPVAEAGERQKWADDDQAGDAIVTMPDSDVPETLYLGDTSELRIITLDRIVNRHRNAAVASATPAIVAAAKREAYEHSIELVTRERDSLRKLSTNGKGLATLTCDRLVDSINAAIGPLAPTPATAGKALP